MKCLVCIDTTQRYFNIYNPITIQVDDSWKGLGAILFQDSHPVVFATKSLTPAEQHCANIKHELLACVFGVEWFHAYVFGHTFTVESDHKPFEKVKLNNPADAPACL